MYRAIIMQALEDRRVLDLSYAGGAPFAVQPHAILRKPDGTEVLEAYQVSGFGNDTPSMVGRRWMCRASNWRACAPSGSSRVAIFAR